MASKSMLFTASSAAPFLACLAYIVTSTSLTLANKYIFSSKLDYPWALLTFQSLTSAFLLSVVQLCRRSSPLSLSLTRQIFFPCLLFTLYIFTNARALRSISLPILSVIKSLGPIAIALSERFLFGNRISALTVAAMVLIVVSNGVTALNDMDYNGVGYAWSFSNVIVNTCYVVSLRACLSNKFTAIQKTIHANLFAASMMLPLAMANKQLIPFLNELPKSSVFFRQIYMLSCVLAGCIGISIFWLIEVTSGSTLSFAGACNKFTVIVLGGILFETNISVICWISVMGGVVASILFGVSKLQNGGNLEVVPKTPSTVIAIDSDSESQSGNEEKALKSQR